jgi:ferredoxin-NADP reductase
VTSRVNVADGVVGLTLTRPDRTALPRWTPGAHIDVVLPSGAERQYSLCGSPDDRCRWRIAVRRIHGGDGGSVEVHEKVQVGTRLTVRGPRNAFPMTDEPGYLFVAGGIGITPLLPMIERAAQAGADWRLVQLGRDAASTPFTDELACHGHRVVVPTDDAHGGPPTAAEVLALGTGGAPVPPTVFLCGPPPLADAVRAELAATAPTTLFHSERFSAPPVHGGEPFRADLARSGRSVDVGADETLLAALRREIPGIAYSCRQGFCGTCKVRVLAGEIDHRDTLLTPAERDDAVLVCLSRARGEFLVLDL